jgi:hypothetical protein
MSCDMNLASSRLQAQQSEFITSFQHTNISVPKYSVWIIRKQETNISACSRIA